MRHHIPHDKAPPIAIGAERADVSVHVPQPVDVRRGVVERRVLVPDRLQAAQSTFRIGFVPRVAIAAHNAIDVGRTRDRGVGTKFDVQRIGNSRVQGSRPRDRQSPVNADLPEDGSCGSHRRSIRGRRLSQDGAGAGSRPTAANTVAGVQDCFVGTGGVDRSRHRVRHGGSPDQYMRRQWPIRPGPEAGRVGRARVRLAGSRLIPACAPSFLFHLQVIRDELRGSRLPMKRRMEPIARLPDAGSDFVTFSIARCGWSRGECRGVADTAMKPRQRRRGRRHSGPRAAALHRERPPRRRMLLAECVAQVLER